MAKLIFCISSLFFLLSLNIIDSAAQEGSEHLGKSPNDKQLIDSSEVWKSISEEINFESLLNNYLKNDPDQEKRRDLTYMGYVTPWNSKGYDFAINNAKKFSIVSPSWFEPKLRDNFIQFFNLNTINITFINKLREKNPNIKIVPRIMASETLSRGLYSDGSPDKKKIRIENIADQIISFLHGYNFDGMVFESHLPIMNDHDFDSCVDVLTELAKSFTSQGMIFIYVVPPLYNFGNNQIKPIFSQKGFEKILKASSYISVMTYDYSSYLNPGFQSPLNWMKATIEYYCPRYIPEDRAKILLGINLYGRLFDTKYDAITGDQFIDLIKKSSLSESTSKWDPNAHEHTFTLIDKENKEVKKCLYPSQKSLHDRLELAKLLGTGVAFWELGQPLDYFYELL